MKRLTKWLQGKATSKEKVSVVWQTLAFIASNFLLVAGAFFGFMLLIIIMGGASSQSSGGLEMVSNLPPEVLQWKSKVTTEAKKNEVPEIVDVILAIIAVESGGNAIKTPDIMQCSESQGRPPNSIQDPNESIEVGVKYFADMYKGTGKKDVWNVAQAYNYGGGYLLVATGTYSFEEAKAFSREKAGGIQVMYTNPVALALGYSYRYNYGNMFYVALCKQFFTQSEGTTGNGKFMMPIDNPILTSGFANRIHPQTGIPEHHLGLDFANPQGSPIKASRSGTVVISEFNSSYGNYIVIDHHDGYWTAYAHQSQLKAKVGAKVSQGEVIGLIGSTGDSTGPHLHLEIRTSIYSGHVDPAPLLGV